MEEISGRSGGRFDGGKEVAEGSCGRTPGHRLRSLPKPREDLYQRIDAYDMYKAMFVGYQLPKVRKLNYWNQLLRLQKARLNKAKIAEENGGTVGAGAGDQDQDAGADEGFLFDEFDDEEDIDEGHFKIKKGLDGSRVLPDYCSASRRFRRPALVDSHAPEEERVEHVEKEKVLRACRSGSEPSR